MRRSALAGFVMLASFSVAAACGSSSSEQPPSPGPAPGSGVAGSGSNGAESGGVGSSGGGPSVDSGTTPGAGTGSGSASGSGSDIPDAGSREASSASGATPDAGSSVGPIDAGKTPGKPGTGAVTVDPGKTHQTIDGFGGADTWAPGGALSAATAKLLYDPSAGIGLSILRIGIDVNGSAGNPNGYVLGGAAVYSDIKQAAALVPEGLKVWGAPWSPPAADKDNGNLDNGGHLLTSAYDSWSSYLASVPAVVSAQTGVPLFGVSVQNEPDFTASYASCLFSSAQMVSFIQVLGPKLAALTPPVTLIAAEPDTWGNTWSGDNFGTAILGDAVASSAVGIIATHDYDHESSDSPTRPAPPATMKQHFWETEVSDLGSSADADMVDTGGGGLRVAIWVHAALTSGGANAWHHWWLVSSGAQGLLIQGNAQPPKRYYTVGNFSKFVRPGYVRVDVSGSPPTGVYMSAFENPANAKVVVVAINSTASAVTLPVFVAGSSWPASVTPYVTDASNDLAAQAPIALSGAQFTATLGAQSVTTFVGVP